MEDLFAHFHQTVTRLLFKHTRGWVRLGSTHPGWGRDGRVSGRKGASDSFLLDRL